METIANRGLRNLSDQRLRVTQQQYLIGAPPKLILHRLRLHPERFASALDHGLVGEVKRLQM
jgi:hypothetical protein